MSATLFSNEDERKAVIKLFGKTEKDVETSVAIMRKWLEEQPHLPEVPCDAFIERFLLNNKFSIEITKARMDMFYTIRTIIPDLYENRQPRFLKSRSLPDKIIVVPLPKLTPEYYRVTILKYIAQGPDVDYEVEDMLATIINGFTLRLMEDYQLSNIILIDCGNFGLHQWKKLTPMVLKKFVVVIEKVLSNRIRWVQFFNIPPYIDFFMGIILPLLKQKLAKRVQLCKTLEASAVGIPNEMLPVDYGGQELSTEELNELLLKKFDEYEEWFEKLAKMKVNESLRPEPLKNDENLGFYGNFRKIDVD